MGILDKVAALLPGRSERREGSSERGGLAARQDLDRWWPMRDEPAGSPAVGGLGWIPPADMHETDDEVVVTMEVPGLDREDLNLVMTPGGLIVRGEKRAEREDKRKDFYVTELRYGSFVRTVPLPPGLDVDRAKARVANGVLTVRFPKVADHPGARRVPITT
jgi:HSP20 family protein